MNHVAVVDRMVAEASALFGASLHVLPDEQRLRLNGVQPSVIC